MQYPFLLQQKNFIEINDCLQKQLFAIFFSIVILLTIYFVFSFYTLKQKKQQSKKLLLLETSSEEKNKIINILNENKDKRLSIEQENSQFQEFNIGNNLDLVETSFSINNFDQQEKKEEFFQQLVQYFQKYFIQIQRMYLIVDFEEITKVKAKFAEDLENLKKFSKIMDIIITNYQQGENEFENKQNLLNAFSSLVKDQNNIHFISNNIQIEELKELLILRANLFNFKDTIFEEVDESECKRLCEAIHESMKVSKGKR